MLEKIKKLTNIALIAGFLSFIYLVLVMTYTGPVQKTVEGTRFTFAAYEDLSKKFEDILQKNLYKKYGFINLNGRINKALRINSLNGIQKLKNGYLTDFGYKVDIRTSAQSLIELNKFLEERNIRFVYILAPCKTSFYDVQFAPGYHSNSWENIDNIFNILKSANLNTLNMNDLFEKHSWKMEDTFFITDNHWLPQAGLETARCTMELLARRGISGYNEEWLDDRNYNITVLKNWLLGAWGRRVGKYYAGSDSIAIYRPKFTTDYMYAGLKINSTEWIYRNNILDLSYTRGKDYFGKSPYDMYMYSDYPLRITINTKGYNNKRVLILGDSFKLPLEYFLTTQFQEIYTIDLRKYTDGTLAQYVEEIKPDIVIMCTDERELSVRQLYTFGVKEYLAALEKPLGSIQDLEDIKIRANDKNNNKFEVMCSNLEPNQTYTLTLERTELSGVKNSFVQMTLQDLSENKAIYNRYFDANSSKTQKWIFNTPEKVENTYGIYLYAGTKGHTANISVKVGGIRLRKGIFEQ